MSCRPTRYHVDDGRDVGTRTHAWHDEKKAELQRKERELKRAQKQQVGFRPIRSSSLVHSYKQRLCHIIQLNMVVLLCTNAGAGKSR